MLCRPRGWLAGTVAILSLACGTTQSGDDAGDGGQSGIAGSTARGGSSSGTAGAGGNATGGTSGNAGTGAGAASGSGSAGTSSSVTWSEHVAPLVFRECVGCHREGGIGSFSMTTYAEAARNAAAMADATAVRYMPPMPVDNSGDCNTYSNARWLNDGEIALLAAWDAAGAPEGDPARTPPVPQPAGGLDRVDLTLDAGTAYTPNPTRSDDYRCFVVDPGTSSDAFVTGYEVLPGDPRIVHHVIVYAPNDDEEAVAAEALDAGEPGLGYTCFGSSGVDATPLVLWAPGGGAIQLPNDTGLPMIAGRKLVMQVHYNVAGGTYPDQTVVRLQTKAAVGHPAAFLPIPNTRLQLPPGQLLVESTRTLDLADQPLDITIHGVLPHMHTLGRTLKLTGSIGGADQCVTWVDRWDFNWQGAWWYDTPLSGSTSSLTLTCGYDTRERTETVTWGEGTQDEMCLAYLYVTAR
jgi:hypothetical protein